MEHQILVYHIYLILTPIPSNLNLNLIFSIFLVYNINRLLPYVPILGTSDFS